MELNVRLEDMGDTVGGIESSSLDDISAAGPSELLHPFLDTHTRDLAHAELRVSDPELLVQTISPIVADTECQSLDVDVVRHKVPNRVTDEEVRMLDIVL